MQFETKHGASAGPSAPTRLQRMCYYGLVRQAREGIPFSKRYKEYRSGLIDALCTDSAAEAKKLNMSPAGLERASWGL